MEPMTHTEGDLVLCPACGVALRYSEVFRVYTRMSPAQWLTLTNEDQRDLIRERRTLALTHVMTEDWRYELV